MTTPPNPSLILFDNGSLRPEPTLRLRRIAGKLGARLDQEVIPTSLLHSDRIDPADLEDRGARLVRAEIERLLAAGQNRFVLLPFFIGPSGALTDYLPGQIKELQAGHPTITVSIADSLGRLDPEPDLRLADALHDQVAHTMADLNGDRPEIIVVDHGSPVRPVGLLRDQIAARLAECLGPSVPSVRAASMERPEGDAYAFNDPLLAQALADRPPGRGPVVVCQLFLAPGRHAGPDGDIASICRNAEATEPGLRIIITDPIGLHPTVTDILTDRAREAIGRLQAGA